jgi:hypothetical protein
VAAIQAIAGIELFAHLGADRQAPVVGPGVVAADYLHMLPAIDIDAHVERQSSGTGHRHREMCVVQAQRLDVIRQCLIGGGPGHREAAEKILGVAASVL